MGGRQPVVLAGTTVETCLATPGGLAVEMEEEVVVLMAGRRVATPGMPVRLQVEP